VIIKWKISRRSCRIENRQYRIHEFVVITVKKSLPVISIRNQLFFLKRPWRFTFYTLIGGAWPIYFGDPNAQKAAVVATGAGVVIVVNLWFYLSLKQTLSDQKRSDSNLS
jgi:hypothetical protein